MKQETRKKRRKEMNKTGAKIKKEKNKKRKEKTDKKSVIEEEKRRKKIEKKIVNIRIKEKEIGEEK